MGKTYRYDADANYSRPMVPPLRAPMGQKATKRERRVLHGPVTIIKVPKPMGVDLPVFDNNSDSRRDYILGY